MEEAEIAEPLQLNLISRDLPAPTHINSTSSSPQLNYVTVSCETAPFDADNAQASNHVPVAEPDSGEYRTIESLMRNPVTVALDNHGGYVSGGKSLSPTHAVITTKTGYASKDDFKKDERPVWSECYGQRSARKRRCAAFSSLLVQLMAACDRGQCWKKTSTQNYQLLFSVRQ